MLFLTGIKILWNLQVSLSSWPGQPAESIQVKKHGDDAFHSKDFMEVVECYSRVFSQYHMLRAIVVLLYAHKLCYSSPITNRLHSYFSSIFVII
jgi:hypothetical protein